MFATLYIELIEYIVILIALTGLIYVVKKPIVAFYIMVFTLPFKNFYVWVGTDLHVWKLLSIAFLIIQSPKWLLQQKRVNKTNRYIFMIVAYFIYAVFITAINGYFFDKSSVLLMSGGFFKNEGRFIFQFLLFIITLNLIMIPMQIFKSTTEVVTTVKVLLYALTVLAVFGVIQYSIMQLMGVDIFPIHGSDGIEHSGYIYSQYGSVFRLNSLAGEPKHLAIAMVIGICIVILGRASEIKIVKYDLLVLVLFSFNLVFTYSTTGYTLIAMTLLMVVITQGVTNWRAIALVFCVLIMAFYAYNNLTIDSATAIDTQIQRTGLEIQDETILSYLLDEPAHAIIGTGLGNIHHFAVQYLPINYPIFRDTPYKANSGILYMLADVGLIGMSLLYISLGALLWNNMILLKSVRGVYHSEMKVVIYASLIVSVLFLARYYELFFMLFGVMLSLNYLLRNMLKTEKSELKRLNRHA